MRGIKYLFLSYSSENIIEAEALRSTFEKGGIKVWMAKYDIGAGEDFADSIQSAIDKCSCFVMLLTEEAQKSPWVTKELDFAISNNKPIIPVQLKPVALSQVFKFNLINTQIIALKTIDINHTDTQRLISTVKNYMNGKPWMKLRKNGTFHFDKKWIILSALTVTIVFVVLVSSALSKLFSNISGNDSGGSISNIIDTVKGGSLPTPSDSEINQIPDFFEDEILALEHADELTKINKTKKVKVGEYISLSTVWTDAVVYSQDASIAVGEGSLVKGVSPGTTYVIIAPSKNVSSTYYIIVE